MWHCAGFGGFAEVCCFECLNLLLIHISPAIWSTLCQEKLFSSRRYCKAAWQYPDTFSRSWCHFVFPCCLRSSRLRDNPEHVCPLLYIEYLACFVKDVHFWSLDTTVFGKEAPNVYRASARIQVCSVLLLKLMIGVLLSTALCWGGGVLSFSILLAVCWLLPVSSDCCFLPLCLQSELLWAHAKNSVASTALVSACCLLPVWGLEKAWERVCPVK